MNHALGYRVAADRERGDQPAPGSFANRVSAADFDRLVEPLRGNPRLLARGLDGRTVAAWEAKLDRAWAEENTELAHRLASELIEGAAVARDEIDVLLTIHADPPAYFAAVFHLTAQEGAAAVDRAKGARAILFEIVLEADLLMLWDVRSPAPLAEFVGRYPRGPYTATVLFVLAGLLADQGDAVGARRALAQLAEDFPAHPLAAGRGAR